MIPSLHYYSGVGGMASESASTIRSASGRDGMSRTRHFALLGLHQLYQVENRNSLANAATTFSILDNSRVRAHSPAMVIYRIFHSLTATATRPAAQSSTVVCRESCASLHFPTRGRHSADARATGEDGEGTCCDVRHQNLRGPNRAHRRC